MKETRHLAFSKWAAPLTVLFLLLAFHSQSYAQYVTNGSASGSGSGCYDLTPDAPGQAGTIFSASPIDLTQPFSLSCTYNFGPKDANGADGIVFIFATTNGALGIGGGSMGYDGITPSIAIEVDDYQNGNFGDPAADHMAIYSMGSVNHLAATNLVGPNMIGNVEDGQDHCFSVNWDPASNTLSASLDGNAIAYTGDITGGIFGGNSSVFYGFSAATGSLSNAHRVCFNGPQLVPMQDVTICPGQSAPLQADPAGTSWTWTPSPSLSATNISNPVATPTTTTTYNVTIQYNCGFSATDDVTVNVATPPNAMASSNSPLCEGETLFLSASGGVSYQWSGPFFTSSDQNPQIPNVGLAQAGVYSVVVTDADGCTNTASTTVVVNPLPLVAIVPVPFPVCENAQPITLQAFPAGGVWGGAANAAGQFDPAAEGPGFHQVTYIFTDQNGCIGTNDIFIEVVPAPEVTIFQPDPFCQTDPLQNLLANPPGGIWGGAANVLGEVDPAAFAPGTYLVTYTYFDANNCEGYDDILITILPGTPVQIQPAGPFCPTSPPVTLSATPMGGAWGGAANATGQVNPATLGPGTHEVIYSVTSGGACPGLDTIEVEVWNAPTASIAGSGTLCEGNGQNIPLTISANGAPPITVTYLVDGADPTTITVPVGTTTLPASESGIYTISTVTDANGCTGLGSGSAMVEVVGAPEISAFDTECDATNTSYTVTFQVSGGDPATYSVTGSVPGSLSANPPYIFTSDPIPSGSSYNFVVNDDFDCDPTTLSGSFSCQCLTDAGTMSNALLTACANGTVQAAHLDDEFLDANDQLVFVLHSSNGNSLGTVFGTNGTGVFGLVPPMVPGVTYYISAVAGDSTTTGGVDLTDPCLSVSFGQPVLFNPMPQASLADDAEICEGETATLTFTLTGNAPFDVVYSNGSQNFTLNNVLNGHTVQVSPSATTTYSLVSTGDNSVPACTTLGGNDVTVTVRPHVAVSQVFEICQGESLFLGGADQTVTGIYLDTLATVHGCDSIITSTLIVNGLDTTLIAETSCNPANVGTVTQVFTNQFGCDSTVIVTTTFSSTDTTYTASQSCDPAATGVFTQLFVTPEGCDSTVIETVTLLPSDTTTLFDTSCNPANVGTVTQVLTNQFGCDSTVFLITSFSQTDTTLLSATTCDPAAAGVFTQNLVTPEGCDSIVIETVVLLPSDTTYLTDTSCDPASVGVFEQVLANQFGCDSTVILTVTYSLSDTTVLTSTTCDPAEAGVFTQNLVTPEGCDSVVIETVALLPSNSVQLTATTCDPNGVGVFTQLLTNQFGCDSTVVTTVSLLPSDSTFVMATSCEPQDTGVAVVVFTNQFGCDSTVVTTTTLLPLNDCGIEVSLNPSSIPCGGTTGAISLFASVGTPPIDYFYTGPTSNSGSIPTLFSLASIGNLPPGDYFFNFTDDNGLFFDTVVTILQIPTPVLSVAATSDFNGYAVSCPGASDGTAIATATNGVPPYDYLWSNGQTGNTASGLSGSVQVTVTDAEGCDVVANVPLPIPPALSISFVVNDLDCFGQNDGAVTVVVEGGVPDYEFMLNSGGPQASANFPGLGSGTYEVEVADANGCTATEVIGVSAPIPVSVELGDDQYIELGEGTSLTALVNLPYDSLNLVAWENLDSVECPTCLDQPIMPLFTTTYSVSVTAENGCSDEDDVTVFVDRRRHVYVPNAFSPNGDGLNDGFMLFAKPNTVKRIRSFLVFDRWGETVWEYFNFLPNDPAYGWDGVHRGEPMDPAVFVWFAEVEFLDGAVLLLEGDVSLVR